MLVLVIPVLQVNAERVVPLARDVMDVVVSQPELCVQIPKAFLVLLPAAVEVY